MTEDKPVGQRFSQVYLSKSEVLRDSLRFRNRLRVLFQDTNDKTSSLDFAKLIEHETGTTVPYGGYGRDWRDFWISSDLRDVLDSITIIYFSLVRGGYSHFAKPWHETVSRFFLEENLSYSLDAAGGVHFVVDSQFERDRATTLAGLVGAKYESVRHSFENAFDDLDKSPANTQGAVRSIFDSLENLIKLWFPDRVSRLGASEVEKFLKPVVLANRSGADRDSANLLLNSFVQWINAAHQYRHAGGTEHIAPPPIDTTIVFLSTGAAFLRWLIDARESTD